MFSLPSGMNVSSSRAPPPKVTTTALRPGFVAPLRRGDANSDAHPIAAPVVRRRNSRRLCEMLRADRGSFTVTSVSSLRMELPGTQHARSYRQAVTWHGSNVNHLSRAGGRTQGIRASGSSQTGARFSGIVGFRRGEPADGLQARTIKSACSRNPPGVTAPIRTPIN